MKTVSLELSKQLKEAGYTQEGYFVWTLLPNDLYSEKPTGYSYQCMPAVAVSEGGFASPTADEILDMLPAKINFDYLQISKPTTMYQITYVDINGSIRQGFDDISLADAAAKMWLYLKKENLLSTIKEK